MMRFSIFMLILFSLTAASCSSRKNKVDHSNMIPEKDLKEILTDLHLTDGMLVIPKINQWYTPSDTLIAHTEVIEKHGYTKEEMDKTMLYYFVKKPKKLIEIYDQVLGVLSEMETRYEKEVIILQAQMSNLWKENDSYFLPDSSVHQTAPFKMNVSYPGTYYLSFTATLSPADESIKPYPLVFTCNADSLETGRRHYSAHIPYIKDGQPHKYTLIVKAKDNSHLHLKGMFYTSDYCMNHQGQHIRIEKISLSYISGAE